MGWNEVDNKHRREYGKSYIACDERYEKDFVIETILEELPSHSRKEVEAAINRSCDIIKSPRRRKEFLQCVAKELGQSYY